jgi:hypothetical protein
MRMSGLKKVLSYCIGAKTFNYLDRNRAYTGVNTVYYRVLFARKALVAAKKNLQDRSSINGYFIIESPPALYTDLGLGSEVR